MTTSVKAESTTGVRVELTDLTRVYGTVRALDGLTLPNVVYLAARRPNTTGPMYPPASASRL